jgi:hypothetical protein
MRRITCNRNGPVRWHTARRFRNAQLTLNCLDELSIIADYRRSEEVRLLLGESDAC